MCGPSEFLWSGLYYSGSVYDGNQGSAVFRDKVVHEAKLNEFWGNKTEFTHAQLQKYADTTGYVTVSVRGPTAEEVPNVLPENLKVVTTNKHHTRSLSYKHSLTQEKPA